MKVLDLDMDYFMTDIAHTPFSSMDRLSEQEYGDSVWDATAVRSFLEKTWGYP